MSAVLLLLCLAQDRFEVAEQMRRLAKAYDEKGAPLKGESRDRLNDLLNRAKLVEARELLDGTATTVRIVPVLRLLEVGPSAYLGYKVLALHGQEGKVTVRIINRREEVVAKAEATYGTAADLALTDQAEGTYWIEAEGLRSEIQLVRGLRERLAKLNADLPGERQSPAAASLDFRLKTLRDLQAGRPAEIPGDIPDELASLEADVAVLAGGGEPYGATRTGDQRRAVMGPKGAVPYRLFVPKDLPKGGAPLIVALHDAGASENFWFEVTRLLSYAKGAMVVAPRAPGATFDHVAPVIAQVRKEYAVSRVWLLGHGMGGGQALALAEAEPERFAGVIAMAPEGNADVTKLKGLEVYVCCGAKDSRIENTRRIGAAAKGMANVTVEERPDLEHLTILWETLKSAVERVR